MADEKKCKYCSMMIPVDAKICPHCRKNQGITFIQGVLIIVVIFFVGGSISALLTPDKVKETAPQNNPIPQTAATQPVQQQEAPTIKEPVMPEFNPPEGAISAKNLYEVYEANEVAADEKYKDKRFIVYGKIKGIEKNIANQPYISLDAGILSFINCRFSKDQIQQLVSLQKGKMIAIEGTCSGKMVTSVFLHDCELRSER